MSKTVDLPFSGGAVVDPSGETPSAQAHNVFLRKINIVDAGHELPVYAMFDKKRPTTTAPYFEPVSAFTLAEWCNGGDVVQVDLSEAMDSPADTYAGLLQEISLENDAQSGPYVNECTLRTMVKRGSTGVRYSWFWLCLVMDQDTGITYLATPVLNNPITLDVPDHKVQVEQTDTPNYLANKISGDGETIGVEVVRQNALGQPIDPFLRIKSLEPKQTPLSKHNGVNGLKVVTNKFGQVTELSDGSISAFEIKSGVIKHVLTADDISNGYFDVVLGLPEMTINGITLTPEFVLMHDIVFTVSITNQKFNGPHCSLRRLDVVCNYDGSFHDYYCDLICSVTDFNKDEFGRAIDYRDTQYSYTFVKRLTSTLRNMSGIIIRCYINPDYEFDPIVPGLEWVCSTVNLIAESPVRDFGRVVIEITTVKTPNTLRFRFSDPNYNPVAAGVGTSGTWTKRAEYQAAINENVWDWTCNNSRWDSAFENAWTSEEMGVELVAAGDTSAITGVLNLFRGCSSLKSAVAFDTSNVVDFYGMFFDCTGLSAVPYFKTNRALTVASMFDGCTDVKSGALALYTRISGQATPPDDYHDAFKDCGKDTAEGLAELQQIPASWGGLAP